MLNRAVNEGFSGGEKKRNEIFQMAVLEPTLAILDETDSGLDIDALKIVADGVNALRSPDRAIIVVTHYQRLLNYIVPDFVHVLTDGRIVRSGGKELALELEAEGLRLDRGRSGGSAEREHDEPGRRTSRDAGGAPFEAFRARAGVRRRTGSRRAREAAFDRFVERGFPTTRDEEWRFTNVAPIAATRSSSGRARPSTPTRATLEPFLFAGRRRDRIVVVNGRVVAESVATRSPAGGRRSIAARSRHRATTRGRALVGARSAGTPARSPRSTRAFFEDGVVRFASRARSSIERRSTSSVVTTSAGGRRRSCHPRVLDRGRRARRRCTIVESYVGARRRRHVHQRA